MPILAQIGGILKGNLLAQIMADVKLVTVRKLFGSSMENKVRKHYHANVGRHYQGYSVLKVTEILGLDEQQVSDLEEEVQAESARDDQRMQRWRQYTGPKPPAKKEDAKEPVRHQLSIYTLAKRIPVVEQDRFLFRVLDDERQVRGVNLEFIAHLSLIHI